MIKEAAIVFEGVLYRGRTHAVCAAKIERETGGYYGFNAGREGFLDENGVFHDRFEAAQIAFKCGQIKTPTNRLLSSQI